MKTALLVATLLCVTGVGRAGSIDEALSLYRNGDNPRAALALYEVMKTSPNPDHRSQAKIYLAETLRKLDLTIPAMFYYTNLLTAGRSNRYYLNALNGLLNLQIALSDPLLIPSLVDRHMDPEGFGQLDRQQIDQVNYLVGEMSFRRQRNKESRAFLMFVTPKSPLRAAKAKYLLALLAIRDCDMGVAAQHLVDVLRSLTANDPESKRLRNLSRLALARTEYGRGRYAEAATLFAAVEGDFRSTAEVEAGWALLSQKDYVGALRAARAGQRSDRYHRDALIIESTVYFLNCMWPAALRAARAFREQYGGAVEALETYLKEEPAPERVYLHIRAEGLGHYPAPIARQIGDLRRFREYHLMLTKMQLEVGQIDKTESWRGSQLQVDLGAIVVQQHDELESAVGAWIGTLLRSALALLKIMGNQARTLETEALAAEKMWRDRGLPVAAGQDLAFRCFDPKEAPGSYPANARILARADFSPELLTSHDQL